MAKDELPERGLNPALKSGNETSHDNRVSSEAPIATASVQREEGRAWPFVWAVVAVVSALLLLWLLIF